MNMNMWPMTRELMSLATDGFWKGTCQGGRRVKVSGETWKAVKQSELERARLAYIACQDKPPIFETLSDWQRSQITLGLLVPEWWRDRPENLESPTSK